MSAPRAGYPPGPPLRALPRLLLMLATDRLGMMTEAASSGDAVRVALGPRAMYVFNHPDYAKHVLADNGANYHKGIGLVQSRRALGDGLLTSDGESWREQRETLRPAFRPGRINMRASVVASETARLARELAEHQAGGPVDLAERLTGLTLGVLGGVLLATEIQDDGRIAHAFEAVQDQALFDMVTQDLVPTWLPLASQRRFRAARRELSRVVGSLVADRSARMSGEGGADEDDALALMIRAAQRRPDAAGARRMLRDGLVTMLLAGHETTASTLSWTLWLLARHPGIRERVRAEARSVLGDRLPEAADLHSLTYTTQVVQEALRLYPPVWMLPRVAMADDEIAGYRVTAGADVLVSPYTLHRHPEFWDRPQTFDPDRFSAEQVAGRPRYAYIPFGGGARFCVGSSLGMMEAVFVTAVFSRDLELTVVPEHRAVAEPMLSLRMRGGLPVSVRRAS
ncbi:MULTISPECIES: cytochrome P450 [unclassified Streptomyces]|uniref:cytochrome P450 n=1 Tax=unclassified Streptomyces TaxID=2593676 RepID=UPI000CD58B5E|nr:MULTISPECIES: cytochrome P450 [unclassified Streptomyces]